MARRLNQDGSISPRPTSIRFDESMRRNLALLRRSIAIAHGWNESDIDTTTVIAYALRDAASAAGVTRMLDAKLRHERFAEHQLPK